MRWEIGVIAAVALPAATRLAVVAGPGPREAAGNDLTRRLLTVPVNGRLIS
ncbi:hypothetical protein [Paractinoplanes hotanensis]|uniref:Uncharacterized protein n=1 Tax=Paractinoplanes hotanensis TaxID=2906497 RepID=A0ABT0XR00_9ACTN|nr:hypothetical protein [Actinoplanes hotanensis]MCM4076198.1 hypothetical protein [Actinoplanes hotanensis]